MKNIIKHTGILALAALVFASCAEKLPKNEVRPYGTELNGIKILNAGPNQDKVVEGTVDLTTKTISFPRISAKSNFAELRFEITASEGAALEQETYDFSMDKEETDKSQVIKVVNHNRYTEYICKVGKIAPLKGADFDKAVVHKFAAPKGDNRWSGFDGKNIILSGNGTVVMMSMKDILANKENYITLDLTGVAGGTLPTDCAQLHNGHAYVFSLAGGTASTLNIYYYETPQSAPELIFSQTVGQMGGNSRYGDSVNMDLDEKGNGYIFLPGNARKDVLRLTVKNGKEISSPAILKADMTGSFFYDTITRIDGTDLYIHSGSTMIPRINDENMSTQYQFNAMFEKKEYNSIRIFEFNHERYMYGATVGRSLPTAEGIVYNITKGSSITEALDIFFKQSEIKPLWSQPIGGNHGGTAFANADYYIEKDAEGKDSKLYLFGSAKTEGFFVAEVPIKKLVEE